MIEFLARVEGVPARHFGRTDRNSETFNGVRSFFCRKPRILKHRLMFVFFVKGRIHSMLRFQFMMENRYLGCIQSIQTKSWNATMIMEDEEREIYQP